MQRSTAPAAETGTGDAPAASARPAAPAAPPAPPAWRSLPPIQRTLADDPLLTPRDQFGGSLAAWRDPSFLSPLGHAVGTGEPAGVLHDLAVPVPPSPVAVGRDAEPPLAIPPPAVPARPAAVQRQVATAVPAEPLTVSRFTVAPQQPLELSLPAVAGPAADLPLATEPVRAPSAADITSAASVTVGERSGDQPAEAGAAQVVAPPEPVAPEPVAEPPSAGAPEVSVPTLGTEDLTSATDVPTSSVEPSPTPAATGAPTPPPLAVSRAVADAAPPSTGAGSRPTLGLGEPTPGPAARGTEAQAPGAQHPAVQRAAADPAGGGFPAPGSATGSSGGTPATSGGDANVQRAIGDGDVPRGARRLGLGEPIVPPVLPLATPPTGDSAPGGGLGFAGPTGLSAEPPTFPTGPAVDAPDPEPAADAGPTGSSPTAAAEAAAPDAAPATGLAGLLGDDITVSRLVEPVASEPVTPDSSPSSPVPADGGTELPLATPPESAPAGTPHPIAGPAPDGGDAPSASSGEPEAVAPLVGTAPAPTAGGLELPEPAAVPRDTVGAAEPAAPPLVVARLVGDRPLEVLPRAGADGPSRFLPEPLPPTVQRIRWERDGDPVFAGDAAASSSSAASSTAGSNASAASSSAVGNSAAGSNSSSAGGSTGSAAPGGPTSGGTVQRWSTSEAYPPVRPEPASLAPAAAWDPGEPGGLPTAAPGLGGGPGAAPIGQPTGLPALTVARATQPPLLEPSANLTRSGTGLPLTVSRSVQPAGPAGGVPVVREFSWVGATADGFSANGGGSYGLGVVQRADEPPPEPPAAEPPPPPEPEPAPAPSTSGATAPPTAAAPAGGAGAGTEPEELLKKLFDPLLRRIKTELRLDQERHGVRSGRG
ncbi:hypothetical protein AB0J86_28695 [Micromonospora sp. NPDC049559]|uniref:hypothetical protein n=1 Tax=Micromonospora sp. NPDC049559 TaxID=3155923 RepID=UPI003412BBBE